MKKEISKNLKIARGNLQLISHLPKSMSGTTVILGSKYPKLHHALLSPLRFISCPQMNSERTSKFHPKNGGKKSDFWYFEVKMLNKITIRNAWRLAMAEVADR